MGTLHENLCTFVIISRWILLRMRNVWDEVVEKMKTHILYSVKCFRKSCRLWDTVEQDRQCTQNVTLRSVVHLFYWKSFNYYILWVCVGRLRYPACNPCPAVQIFPHYLINITTSGKRLLNIKCVFDVLYSFCVTHFSFWEEMSVIW
jgi:hypothetical protein